MFHVSRRSSPHGPSSFAVPLMAVLLGGKEINPDVSLSLGSQFSVKFHMLPLDQVIAQELEHGDVIPVPPDYFASA